MSASANRRAARRRRWLLVESLESRHLLAVDWRNPVDSLDLSDDGFVAPNDALLVINELNTLGTHPLELPKSESAPYFDSSGDQIVSPIDALLVINHLNSGFSGVRRLTEGAGLSKYVDVTIGVEATDGSRWYRVQLDANFDRSDEGADVPDQVAVYLVDMVDQNDTLLDRGVNGTSLFTLSERRTEFAPGIATWDGSVLEIDLSRVELRDSALLRFQLLNNDGDTGSQVAIRPLANVVEPTGRPGPTIPTPPPAASPGAPVAFANLSGGSGLTAILDNIRYDDAVTRRFRADLSVRNDGPSVGRDIAVEFPGLPPWATIENPSGLTPQGAPYINLRPVVADGGLETGERSGRVEVIVFAPGELPFLLEPRVVAGPNRAPSLDPLGPWTVTPGRTLSVELSAADLDGDRLTFAILANGPLPTMEFSPDGRLTFRPTSDEVGQYSFDVTVSDGALEVRRAVSVNVTDPIAATTRVSGKVLRTDGQPLVGVTVQIGGVQGLTLADGTFSLDLGVGPVVGDTLKVRGELLAGPQSYPFIAEKLPLVLGHEIFERVDNRIERPIYLPALDTSGGRTINPLEDTRVESAALPGAEVLVRAGTLMNQQGAPFTGTLSITEVPVDLTPISLPDTLRPDLVVTIQPGEMTFASPAPLSLPNRGDWAPGTPMDLWSINPTTGEFEDVGDMRVSEDGARIETVSGGVRNSSWHFGAPPPPPPPDDLDDNPNNLKTSCPPCRKTAKLTSDVELQSGAVIETHELVTYESNGATRGVTLVYDSLRADPRPIVHVELPAATPGLVPDPGPDLRIMARMTVRHGELTYVVPGYSGDLAFGNGGEHFWSYDSYDGANPALQADLRAFPTGEYPYTLSVGYLRMTADGMVGRLRPMAGTLVSVNTIDSPFGAGWGIAGLRTIVVDSSGVALVVDGDGLEERFEGNGGDGPYASPAGDFSTLERIAGTFRRTYPDQTVEQYDALHRLASVTDRHGNQTSYVYVGDKLDRIVDPTGLATRFEYVGSRVSKIVDPTGRETSFEHDGQGNLTSVTDPDGARRQWTYDGDRHITAEVDALGRREETEYGFHGRAIGATQKDGTRLIVSPAQVEGLWPPERTMDPFQPPSPSTAPRGVGGYVDAAGRVTSSRLDSLGQALAEQDRLGALPSVQRDAQNLPIAMIDGVGAVTSFTYDARGNLLTQSDELSYTDQFVGTIGHPGEVDRFVIDGRAGQRLLIDGPYSSKEADLQLDDSHGTFIRYWNTEAAVEANQVALVVLPRDDDYRLDVTLQYDSNGPATGDYRFRVLDADVLPELPLDVAIRGTSSAGRRFFQFHATAGQVLTMSEAGGAPNSSIQYFRPDGFGLAPDLTNDGSSLRLTQTGSYVVVVSPRSGASIESYAWTARVTTPDPVAKSGLDQDFVGTFGSQPDTYDFNAPPGTVIWFNWLTYGIHRALLFDDATNELLQIYTYDSPLYELPGSGDYRLVVMRAGYSNESNDYAFRIDDLSAAPLLNIGDVETGLLTPQRRLVAYRFQGTAGQVIDFGETDLAVDRWLLPSVPSAATGHGVEILPRDGEYLFASRLRDFTAAPFEVSLRPVNAPPALPLDALIAGQLLPGEGRRYYAFEAVAGEKYYLRDRNSSPNVAIAIYNTVTGGREVSSLADELDGPWKAPRSGEFTVVLDAADSDRPATYDFEVLTERIVEAPLVLGAATTATFDAPLQTLRFTFDGTAGQRLYFDRLAGAVGDRRDLVGPDGAVVATFSIGGDSEYLITLPATGTYSLEFDNRRNYELGSRTFRLLNVDSSPALLSGDVRSATFDAAQEFDLYRLTLDVGQTAAIDFPQGAATTAARLFTPGGERVQTTVSPLVFTAATAGEYLIGVESFAASPSGYQIVAVVADPGAPVTPSVLGQVIAGVGNSTEQSVATFDANAGTRVFWDWIGGTGYTMQLYDPLGQLIATGVNTYTAVAFSDKFLTLPHTGTYTVKTTALGAYSFRFLDVAAAPSLTFGDHVAGTIDEPGRSELFRVQIEPGLTTYFDRTDSLTGDISYQLVSPGLAGGPLETWYQQFATGGEYYLAVERRNSPGAFGFTLHDATHAPLLADGATVAAPLEPPTAAALYRFTGEAGSYVWVHSTGGGYWRVRDASGQMFVNVFGEGVLLLPRTGEYWIWRDDFSPDDGDDYSLTVTALDEGIVTIDPSSDRRTAIEYTYDPTFSQLTSVKDETGRLTLFSIDPADGDVLSTTRVAGVLGGADDLTTSYTYHDSGLIASATDPLGRTSRFHYNARGRLLRVVEAEGTAVEAERRFEYDAAGNMTAVIDANGHRTSYEYDARNRLVRLIEADPDGAGPLAAPVTVYAYDAAGNLTSTVDPLGRTTRYAYDALDRLIAETDPAGNVVRSTYDSAGNVVRSTDPLGRSTSYRYDARNRMVSTTDPSGFLTTYAYDAADRLTNLTDAAGNRTSYEYDARGRLARQVDPFGKATTYEYELNNQLIRRIDRLGRAIEWTYDDLGRSTQELWRNQDGSVANTIAHTYDDASNLLRSEDSFSRTTFSWDDLDRASEVRSGGVAGVPAAILTYTYDALGNVLSVADSIAGAPGGLVVYEQDALDRVTSIVETGSGIAPKRVELRYDSLGRMTALDRFADATGVTLVATTGLTFDAADRVTQIVHRNAANAVIDLFTFQYDTASRLTRFTDLDGATDYAYDVRSQLTAAQHADPANVDETYSYDAMGNRQSSHLHANRYVIGDANPATPDGNRLTSDGTYRYSYDDEGNVTQRERISNGQVRQYFYDHRNRLVRVTDRPSANAGDSLVVRYAYDSFDQRISKQVDAAPNDGVDGPVTHFVYEAGDVILELFDADGAGPGEPIRSMRYLHGPSVDQVLAQENELGEVQWLLADHLGTIRTLLDAAGQVVNRLKYDSYGNLIAESNPGATTRYGFTGREFDAETGMTYLRARYYESRIGRFISEDPLGMGGDTANTYGYMANEPTAGADPAGLKGSFWSWWSEGKKQKEKVEKGVEKGKEVINKANENIDRVGDTYARMHERKAGDTLAHYEGVVNSGSTVNPQMQRFKNGAQAIKCVTVPAQEAAQKYADDSYLGRFLAFTNSVRDRFRHKPSPPKPKSQTEINREIIRKAFKPLPKMKPVKPMHKISLEEWVRRNQAEVRARGY